MGTIRHIIIIAFSFPTFLLCAVIAVHAEEKAKESKLKFAIWLIIGTLLLGSIACISADYCYKEGYSAYMWEHEIIEETE